MVYVGENIVDNNGILMVYNIIYVILYPIPNGNRYLEIFG